MSYGIFAFYYDRLTENIDYKARAEYFNQIIRQYITVTPQTILLDLACGTGSLTVELAKLGYDMIGVDASEDMLSEAMSKSCMTKKILYLCQDFTHLDLYGTIDAAVCALDSINHMTDLAQVKKTFSLVSLFTLPGGVFVFDVNTEYKQRVVLGENAYVYDLEDVYCVWQNRWNEKSLTTQIDLDFFIPQGKLYSRQQESFSERVYTHEELCCALEEARFELLAVYEGDTFSPLKKTSQRAVYVARRK